MKLRMLVTLPVAATLVLGVAAAGAAKQPSFATSISYDGPFFGQPFNGIIYGHVASPHPGCVAGRTVKLFLDDGGTLVLADTDRTSDSGVWAAEAPALTVGKVAVLKRQIGKPGKRRLCRGASLIID